GSHERSPTALPVPVLHVIELPRGIARRAAGDRWNWAQSAQIRAVANGARRDFGPSSRNSSNNQGLALLQAAWRYIGDETRSWVSQKLGRVRALRSLDDTLANRLNVGFGTLKRQEHPVLSFGLRHGRTLHHLDPGRGGNCRKVFGSQPDFLVGHCLRKPGHQAGIGFSRIGGSSGAVPEIHHLLHEIFVGEARDVGILWT